MSPSSMLMEVTSRIDDVATAWDELCNRTGAPPWEYPHWYRLWWREFGRGDLEILAARRAGELAGIWVLERRGRELRSAANSETPRHGPVAEDDAAARTLVDALIERRPSRLNLFPLSSDAFSSRMLRDVAAETGYSILDHDLGGSPFVTVGAWDEYVERLDSKMLREIRRRKRRLEELDDLDLVVHRGIDGHEEELERCFALEAAGWKGRAGSAISSRPEMHRFYSDLARAASDRGEFVLALLRLRDVTIAFDLSLERGGVHYLLKTGFDERLANFGPGALLRYGMLKRAFALGLSRYEFLGREDTWKRSWTSETHGLVHRRAFRSRIEGRGFALLRRAKRAFGSPG